VISLLLALSVSAAVIVDEQDLSEYERGIAVQLKKAESVAAAGEMQWAFDDDGDVWVNIYSTCKGKVLPGITPSGVLRISLDTSDCRFREIVKLLDWTP
jgi:hypothetical protein